MKSMLFIVRFISIHSYKVPRLFGVAFTQPDKVRQNEKDDRLWYISTFKFIIHPVTTFSLYLLTPRPSALALLREMSTTFAYHLSQMQELLQDIHLTQQQEGGYRFSIYENLEFMLTCFNFDFNR